MNVWKDILSLLKRKLDPQTFDTWFKPISFHQMDETKIYLKVPNEYFKSWLSENYSGVISEAIAELNLGERRVIFIDETESADEIKKGEEKDVTDEDVTKAPLNPKYTFSTFVVGSCNQFAHAAALAVAERPAAAYNPLYIYGGVGLGKTHLIQAIGHFIKQGNRRLKIAYISAERFMNELVGAIRYDRTHDFRQRYRSIDVLLIDDIQFMSGKERTQEEFFHTFNALYDAQKQIVITSDCPPREIPGLEERLHSRFEWGLIADLQPPEYETKLIILKKKAEMENIDLPDDVADFIARNIKSNIRELEGALIRLVAYASLEGAELDLTYAKSVLRNLVTNGQKVVTPDIVIKAVAKYFNIKPSLLKAKNKSKYIAEPRQIAMYICRELTRYSLTQIGKEFGDKDHTTVLHALRKVEQKRRENKDFHSLINRIIGSID